MRGGWARGRGRCVVVVLLLSAIYDPPQPCYGWAVVVLPAGRDRQQCIAITIILVVVQYIVEKETLQYNCNFEC